MWSRGWMIWFASVSEGDHVTWAGWKRPFQYASPKLCQEWTDQEKILCHKPRPWIFTKGLTKWCKAESEGQSVLCRMWKFTVEEFQNLWLVWSQRKSTMQALVCLVLGDLFAKTEGGIQTLRAENLTQVSKDGSDGHSKGAVTVGGFQSIRL